MKRYVITVLLLVCASLSILICTARSMSGDLADVRLKEVTYMGDVAAAGGLTVISQNHWDNHLLWTTTHRLGYAEDAKTDVSFSSRHRYGGGGREPEYLLMETEIQNGIDFTSALDHTGMTLGEVSSRNYDISSDEGTFREFATDPSLGIAAAYNALYMDAPLNQEVSAVVCLSDYYDYYPISLQMNLPGVIWIHGDLSEDTVAKPGTQAYVVQAFRDYFKIPMLDEVIEIHLTRRNNGMNWGSSDVGDTDSYSLYSLSAANGTDCYFTFNTHTNRGETVIDTSEIRGGYGIYRLPYRKSTSTADIGVDVDAMEMVYPLKPGTKIEGLYFNTAGTRLILITQQDQETVCIDIIDPLTYECLQRFSVSGSYFGHLKQTDGYTVAVTSDSLAVLTEEDGVFTHAFTAEILRDADGNHRPVTSSHAAAFDGTRLAIVGNAYSQAYSWDICGYDVTVYSADGVLWDGTVENTLDVGRRKSSFNSSYDIIPFYGDALTVFWE